jgi:hypothetical protein
MPLMLMKYTLDNARAATLLSESYRPEGARNYSQKENLSLLFDLPPILRTR